MTYLAGPPCSIENSDLRVCPGCPYSGPKCGSRGRLDSPIVFVSEAPGTQEIRHKLPFVGPSGEVFWNTLPLEETLQEWGFSKGDFLILNSCQCLPPRKKNDARTTTENIKKAWRVCRTRLIEQIQAYPRKLIVTCGNHGTWAVTNNDRTKITQIRGQLYESPLSELGILPTLHPAALLRGTGNYRQFRMDIAYAIDLLRGLPKKTPVQPQFIVCDTPRKVELAIRRLIKKPVLDCDIETTGFNRFSDDILAVGISYDPRLVFIFPGAAQREKWDDLQADISWRDGAPSMIPHLSPLYKRYRGKFCWHNGKFDVSFLRKDGLPARVDEDTMIMSYVLDESRGIHDLEQVSGDLIGAPDYKYMVKQWVPRRKDSYARIPRDVLYHYLALDVGNTSQIRPLLRRRISEDPKLEKLYTQLLIPFSETAYYIEQAGMPVSQFAVQRQQKRLQREIERTVSTIQKEALDQGVEGYVNPASPQQMNWILFDVFGLKDKIPKGMQRSTRKEVLEKLPQIPIVKAQREFRKAQKSKGTYADTILSSIEPTTGRVHPTLLLHGTRTGRLAHKIVANIPRDKRIRGMYAISVPQQRLVDGLPPGILQRHGYYITRTNQQRAPGGRIYIKADLDQAELRALAALSGDPELCAIYRDNKRKLHREVANGIFGTPGDSEAPNKGTLLKWANEEYMKVKTLNFGIIYGRQAPSIAEAFNMHVKEAEGYVDYWKQRFPVAWNFLLNCRAAPRRNQTIVTPFGRKKRHWIITRENIHSLENEASNFPEQSVASDIVLEASNKLSAKLRERNVHIVFLVHDELIAEAPDDLATISWARQEIVKELEQAPRTWGITRVPFIADTSIGRRWGIYRHIDREGQWDNYIKSKLDEAIDVEFEESEPESEVA